MASSQILVKLLDGRTRVLQINSPTLSGKTLKHLLFQTTQIPLSHQRLLTGTLEITDETLISSHNHLFPSCTLLLRLRGGKGGFGSLLRGAATKAGQKKTNNFDACRDMSGRRLRHVNAEKRLEEWRAEEEERKLEKIAESFLRNQVKTAKKRAPDGKNSKYLEKYREESEKAVGEVEAAVKESMGSKRKVVMDSKTGSKRLKIWVGEDGEESEDDEEKSAVIDEGNLDEKKSDDEECDNGHSCSVSAGLDSSNDGALHLIKELSDEESFGSDLMQGNGPDLVEAVCEQQGLKSGEVCLDATDATVCEQQGLKSGEVCLDATDATELDSIICLRDASDKQEIEEGKEVSSEDGTSANGDCMVPALEECQSLDNGDPVKEEAVEQSTSVSSSDEGPLDFNAFETSTEMEVLGMERLKMELQARGLKCGGTLQERAARFFMLKTTPIDMLPKKLLAKIKG